MAEDTEKKVLIDVEIKAKEALKNYAELKIKVDELRAAQELLKIKMKGVDDSTEDGKEKMREMRTEYESLGQQIKAYNNEAQNQQKEIQANIRYEQEQAGSLQKLKAELSLNTAAFNRLSEAERNSVKGSMLQRQIQETTEKIKEEEKALGDHRREVGNYAIAGKSLRSEMKELVQQLTEMKIAGDDSSESYRQMADRLSTLKDSMSDVQQETGAFASDTNKLDAGVQGAQALTASFGLLNSTMAATSESSKEYEQIMKNMQIAITALVTLQTLQTAIQKQSILYRYSDIALQKIGINQTKLSAAAIAAENAMKGGGTIATKALAAAQWLWNKALLANPVLLILAGIAALIIGITKLISLFSEEAQAQRESEKASKAYEQQQLKTAAAIQKSNNAETYAVNERMNASRKEVLEMKKNGANATEIAKSRAKAEQDVRDIQIKASREREIHINKEVLAMQKQYNANVILLKTMKRGTEKYEEQKKAVYELQSALESLYKTQKGEAQKQVELSIEQSESEQAAKEEQRKKYQDNASKMLDLQRKLQDEQNKLSESGAKRDFLSQQNWDAQMFGQQQKHEKDKLNMQLRFGQITKSEYDAQNMILSKQQKTFQAKQLADAEAYYKKQRDDIFSLIGKNVTIQIEEINRQYGDAIKKLNETMPEPKQKTGQSAEDYQREMSDYKNYMLNRVAYAAEIEREQQKKIEEIRKIDAEKIWKEFEAELQKKYGGDLAMFTDNESEKNKVEKKMLEERAEQLNEMLMSNKISTEEYKRQIYDNESNLRANASKAIQLQLNRDLLNAKDNAEAKYEATKDALNKELALYAGNADKQLEIQQNLADNEKAIMQERIAMFEQWSGKTMELANSLNSLMKANEDAELQRYEEQNEAKKASLQSRLDSGLISQEQYNKGVATSDKELDKQKKEIARQQAVREKTLKAFEITINTAAAIVKSLPNIPLAAIVGVMGAIQLATLLATPLPKAARGALLKGASHAQGGIMIEAEGGEAIINKRSTAMFAPLLSAINQAGGGIPFAGKYQDGGYVKRVIYNNAGGLSEKQIERAMYRAVSKSRVYLTVEDYRRADANYTKIINESNN